jgi:hypothetical protein
MTGANKRPSPQHKRLKSGKRHCLKHRQSTIRSTFLTKRKRISSNDFRFESSKRISPKSKSSTSQNISQRKRIGSDADTNLAHLESNELHSDVELTLTLEKSKSTKKKIPMQLFEIKENEKDADIENI